MAGRLKIYNNATSTWEYIGGYGKTMPAGDVVGTSDTQTLTNKTLTNPTVNFTDKSITQNVMCRATLSATTSGLTDQTATLMPLATETFDVGGDFNNTAGNYSFTAPVTGYYRVSGMVSFTNTTADKRYFAMVYVDSSEVVTSFTNCSANTLAVTAAFNDILYLSSGAIVQLYARSDAGNNNATAYGNGVRFTYMTIMLVSL